MNLARTAAVIVITAGLAAAVVALVSRTPAHIRLDEPPPGATDPSLGASFSEEQVARHGRYRAPSYLAVALGIALEIVVLVALARGPLARLVDRSQALPGGWLTRAAIAAVVVALTVWVAKLPLDLVWGFAIEHAWQRSTQPIGSWFGDQVKQVGVAVVIAAVGSVAFFGVVRWQPRWWWLIGWLVFTALTALLVFVYPVVIAPLFNTFTPVQDDRLAARIRATAAEIGVDVGDVLVTDASRRTTAQNAYVAGLGETKRVVLYDTLLEAQSDDQVMFVVAHELGHEVERHVVKNLALSSLALLIGFALLARLATLPGLWSWAGASGVADVRALPVLLLFVMLAGLVALPLQNRVSRAFESRADEIAFAATGDPDPAVRAFRQLAFANLADLRPPSVVVWSLYTHPPVRERIRTALAVARASP